MGGGHTLLPASLSFAPAASSATSRTPERSTATGDYTPASDLGHTLALVEALVGQLYLVTVVTVIVGRLLTAGRSQRS
jgi:hypothetical protein